MSASTTCHAAARARTTRLADEGFTLVELLLVAVLLGLLTTILYGTITGILRGRTIVEAQRETSRTAQYALERMTRELTARVHAPLSGNLDGEQGANAPQGWEAIKGFDKKKGSADADVLRFVSSNASQAMFGAVPSTGVVEVEYRLEEPDELSYDGTAEEKSYLLIREEIPSVEDEDVLEARRLRFAIAENVASLNFRFLENGSWRDNWEAARSRLPEVIEITLRLRRPDGELETHRTAIKVSEPRR